MGSQDATDFVDCNDDAGSYDQHSRLDLTLAQDQDVWLLVYAPFTPSLPADTTLQLNVAHRRFTVNTVSGDDDGLCQVTDYANLVGPPVPDCSLAEAIDAANVHVNVGGEPDLIDFHIEDGFTDPDTNRSDTMHRVITSQVSLPAVTDPVVIDAETQEKPDPSDTTPPLTNIPFDGVPRVRVRGCSVPAVPSGSDFCSGAAPAGQDGLILGPGSDGSTVRGLAFTQWTGDAIEVQSDGNIIERNWVGIHPFGFIASTGNGTPPASTSVYANGTGVEVTGSDNLLGGAVADRNLIKCNTGAGVVVTGGSGNTVTGGGIAFNGGLGIDLADDGVTANDGEDADTGANGLQNFPVITAAGNSSGTGRILWRLDSTGGPFTVDFFTTPFPDPDRPADTGNSCGPTSPAEGGHLLATHTVTAATSSTSFATVLPSSLPAGTIVTAIATAADGSTSEHSAPFTATPTVPTANLSLTKTAGNPSTPTGQDVTFTLTVANPMGGDAAPNLTVTDLLPPGLTFQSASPSQGTYSSSSGVWTAGTLAAGSVLTLQIVATVTTTSAVTNIAEITAVDALDPNSTPNNASTAEDDDAAATITPPLADLSLSMMASDTTPSNGQSVTIDLELTNSGPDAATGVQVTDLLPSGDLAFDTAAPEQGTYTSASGLWDVGSLASGASVSLQITATFTGSSTTVNTAEVTASDQADPDSTVGDGMGDDFASVTFTPHSADLRLVKIVDDATPNVGDEIEFTITVSNDGPDAATGVEVTDVLPTGLTFVSANPSQGTYSSSGGLWAVGSLADDASATLTLRATVVTSSATTNEAEVTDSQQGDPDSTPDNLPVDEDDNGRVTVTPQLANLGLNKAVSDPTPNVGDQVVFTVTLTNAGPDTATNVQVTDLLPAGLTYVSDTGGGSYTPGTGALGRRRGRRRHAGGPHDHRRGHHVRRCDQHRRRFGRGPGGQRHVGQPGLRHGHAAGRRPVPHEGGRSAVAQRRRRRGVHRRGHQQRAGRSGRRGRHRRAADGIDLRLEHGRCRHVHACNGRVGRRHAHQRRPGLGGDADDHRHRRGPGAHHQHSRGDGRGPGRPGLAPWQRRRWGGRPGSGDGHPAGCGPLADEVGGPARHVARVGPRCSPSPSRTPGRSRR